MSSVRANTSHSSAQMAPTSCSPVKCETSRRPLEDDGYNDSSHNCSQDIPPLASNTQTDAVSSVDAPDWTCPKNEQDNMHSSTDKPHPSAGDNVRPSDAEAASSDSDAGGENEGDTIGDIMNFPYTTVVPTPTQDFSSLYPSDESTSDDAEQMRSYRERIQDKLRKQLLAQEDESEVLDLSESTELYAPQDNYRHSQNRVDDGNVLHGLDGADLQEIKVAEEPVRNLYLGAATLWGEIEPLTPSGSIKRGEPGFFLVRSVSSTELTSDLCTRFQAPDYLTSNTTHYKRLTESSRLSEFKTASPSKRRRKTSSPEEIAKLARAAAIEDAEAEEAAALEELEKYRDVDLAPLEPIMESETAGDLILHGTPVKAQDREIFRCKQQIPEHNDFPTPSRQKPKRATQLQLQIPSRCSIQLTGQDGAGETEMETSDLSLLTPDQHQEVRNADHPPFIMVIEALPAAIFWCTAAAITRCSMNAFDVLVERLTGLSVKDMYSCTK